MPTPALDAPVRAVLARNRVEGVTDDGTPYRFHCPDRDKFPAQFAWDSCWHAIALTRVHPAAAREELRTLLRAQEPSGLLPHTVFWHRPIRRSRLLVYNVQGFGDRATRTLQPPFAAFAWERVAAASPDDPSFAREALDGLDAQHAYLERERDPDRSGLVALISPDESGLDASPKFDRLMGWRAAGLPGFLLHVRQLRRDRFDLRRVVARGGFCVQEVLASTAHALSLRALSRLSGRQSFRRRAERVEAALLERCWDPVRGLFFDRAYPSGELQRISTWASLAPLALPLPRDVAARLVDNLADPHQYALPFPVPSTAVSEPAFRRRTGPGVPRYWRGSTWVAASWLLHRGLVQHGYAELARDLARRTVRLVAGFGVREYYDPVDGKPEGARAFGMSCLALDLEHWMLETGGAGSPR